MAKKRIGAAATRGSTVGLLIALLSALGAAQEKSKSVSPAVVHPPGIASISICSPDGAGGVGSCPSGTSDTQQIVLAPDGGSINRYSDMGAISDEMQSIFSPGTLGGNRDYLFWVAAGTTASNRAIGVVVLSGGSGPNANGQWTMDFAKSDAYGSYPSGYGPILLPVTGGRCQAVPDGNPAHQDQTFDLSYAAQGSIVKDPSSSAGNLIMIYEGGNSCVGISTATNPDNNAYLSLAVATSLDFGHTWPTYRGTSSFSFVPLPSLNKSSAPNAPMGALGGSVCIGNDCTTIPPANYGRYPVLGPQLSLPAAIEAGKDLIGDGEPSAFVDDASANPAKYLYVVHGYKPGKFDPPLADGRTSDLMIARAQFNGGMAPLSFSKWSGRSFSTPGLGGAETPILPDGSYQGCAAMNQSRHMAAINYVEDTEQYLLTFVCDSPTDPASGSGAGIIKGSAWFYSTSYDLSDQTQWSPAQEITGSWSEYDNSGGCFDYKGWYPTLMSLDKKPGHLSTAGYVFYMWGCQGGGAPGGRQYSSRRFTITVPDFSLGFDQSTITTSAPSKVPVTLNVGRTGGFSGNVTITAVSVLPRGLKLPGFPASTTGDSLGFKIKVKGNVAPGSYPLVFAAKDDSGRERDATLTLRIQ